MVKTSLTGPRKRRKTQTRKNEEEETNLDRLSCFPDDILSHVISFLDMKSAIQTSILSKRYRFLWTQLRTLNFREPGHFVRYWEPGFVSFESRVDYMMQRREPSNLNTFRLILSDFENSSAFLERCIDYAVRHKVQHLRIRAFTGVHKIFKLPVSLLNCSSLITLQLNGIHSGSVELPKFVVLPNLKILRLKNFKFLDSSYDGGLFTGCPCLETLVLNKCFVKLRNLDLKCSNLKNFEIKHWRTTSDLVNQCVITLNAPGLVFFKIQGCLVDVNFKEGLPCLKTACLNLCYPVSLATMWQRTQRIQESFISMLLQMRSVKFLSISLEILKVLDTNPDSLIDSPTVFENLRSIKFTDDNKYREMTLPMKTVEDKLETAKNNNLMFEIRKAPYQYMNGQRNNYNFISIPANVMHYLLESAPSLESITLEIAKEPFHK